MDGRKLPDEIKRMLEHARDGFRKRHHLEADEYFDQAMENAIHDAWEKGKIDAMFENAYKAAEKRFPDDEVKSQLYAKQLRDAFFANVYERLTRYPEQNKMSLKKYFTPLSYDDNERELPHGQRRYDINAMVASELHHFEVLARKSEEEKPEQEEAESESAFETVLENTLHMGETAQQVSFGVDKELELHFHKHPLPGVGTAGLAISWIGAAFSVAKLAYEVPYGVYKSYKKGTLKNDVKNPNFWWNAIQSVAMTALSVTIAALATIAATATVAAAASAAAVAMPFLIMAIGGIAIVNSVKRFVGFEYQKYKVGKLVDQQCESIAQLTRTLRSDKKTLQKMRDDHADLLSSDKKDMAEIDKSAVNIARFEKAIVANQGVLEQSKQSFIKLESAHEEMKKNPMPFVGSMAGVVIGGTIIAAAILLTGGLAAPAIGLMLAATAIGVAVFAGSKAYAKWKKNKAAKAKQHRQVKANADKDDDVDKNELRNDLRNQHAMKNEAANKNEVHSSLQMLDKLARDNVSEKRGLKEAEVTRRMNQILGSITSMKKDKGAIAMINFLTRSEEIVESENRFDRKAWQNAFKHVDPAIKHKALNYYNHAIDVANTEVVGQERINVLGEKLELLEDSKLLAGVNQEAKVDFNKAKKNLQKFRSAKGKEEESSSYDNDNANYNDDESDGDVNGPKFNH